MSLAVEGIGSVGSVGYVSPVDPVQPVAPGARVYGKAPTAGAYDEEEKKTDDVDAYIPSMSIMGSEQMPLPSSIYDASGMQVDDVDGGFQEIGGISSDITGAARGDLDMAEIPRDESGNSASVASGSGGSGSPDSETTTRIVVIDGSTYQETTVIENGVPTVTRTLISKEDGAAQIQQP